MLTWSIEEYCLVSAMKAGALFRWPWCTFRQFFFSMTSLLSVETVVKTWVNSGRMLVRGEWRVLIYFRGDCLLRGLRYRGNNDLAVWHGNKNKRNGRRGGSNTIAVCSSYFGRPATSSIKDTEPSKFCEMSNKDILGLKSKDFTLIRKGKDLYWHSIKVQFCFESWLKLPMLVKA